MAGTKIPQSVLVLIHSTDLDVLLLERADHPGFWQSVTGSRDSHDEPLDETARRELFEETGISLSDPGVGPLLNWDFQQVYEIFPHWRHRYPDGVTQNTEHVFSVCVPKTILVTLSAREHLSYQWKHWRDAAEQCFSWSNAKAIRELPARVRKNARLRLATYNIHKGRQRTFPRLKRDLSIHDVQAAIRQLHADIVCLQEVQGRHDRHALHYHDWPSEGQHDFLAPDGYHVIYSSTANYLHGHHGNAILSRYPIVSTEARDFSDHALEKRATLHAVVNIQGQSVHIFVVHFGLFAGSRRRQEAALSHWIQHEIPANEPIIIAGDFNDWRLTLGDRLASETGVTEVTRSGRKRPLRTFPSFMPMMHMDRVFQRGFSVLSFGTGRQTAPSVHNARGWSRLSDHVPVVVDLELRRDG
jgi:endonuclease/exonuclease/phosphatase family metal-dependent hydrolase/8-oxo-dGTP pyrophosphatase MutT (NUDIX family)